MLISCITYLKDKGLEWRNVKIYGQEINALTSAIGRMNLFLHGVKDFFIVNDDTLKNPAFLENEALKKFDLILANPPYSISQWDREAFSSDKYGRNFLGTPPQGRADYAFFQHILKSMDPVSGRCAILFPHGILFRKEESALRENLVKSDLVECVIGLAPNLFFNSPMEACIVICRSKKRPERKGKILFINAVHEVTRRNAQSFLEEEHIDKIASAYFSFEDAPEFSRVVPIDDIERQRFSLNISLYISSTNNNGNGSDLSLAESIELWNESRNDLLTSSNSLIRMLSEVGEE
jgi:type I restriction enzyme M protein